MAAQDYKGVGQAYNEPENNINTLLQPVGALGQRYRTHGD